MSNRRVGRQGNEPRRHSDLDAFVELARIAEREAKPSPAVNPDKVLRAEAQAADLLHRNELSRLRCSFKIASVAGDAPDSVHRILYTIVQDLSREGFIYLSLTCSKQWLDAIAWALHHPATSASDSLPHPGKDRQWAVGNACRALRNQGHHVDIGALGPAIDAAARTRIAREVDSLADLEIDLAVRDGPDIVLFESKAKSLTSKARTGDNRARSRSSTTVAREK